MKKISKILLIIQIQLIFIALVYLLAKVNDMDKRVYNTNKFIHELLVNKRIEDLKTPLQNDIVLGDENAPLTMYFFTRFDCSACNKFMQNTFPKIEEEYIASGKAKLIIRYLVNPNKPESLYATKCAYVHSRHDLFKPYAEYLDSNFPDIDTTTVNDISSELLGDINEISEYVLSEESNFIIDIAKSARKAGVRFTPTVIINDEKVVGTKPFKKYKQIIDAELEALPCD